MHSHSSRSSAPSTPHPVLRALLVAIVALAALPALGQNRVADVNALYDTIRPDDRSDRILLPKVAQMAPPPPGVDTLAKARLQFVGSQVWDAASAWAEAPAQQAVLETLDRVTAETDYRIAMAFGQPYGVDQLEDIDLIEAGLYTELDVAGSPILAGARFLYLDKLEWVGCLVHVEATRRAGRGDLAGALDVIGDWIFLSRQIADREFAKEMTTGMAWLIDGLERSRDIVYADAHADRVLAADPAILAGFIDRLVERTRDGQQAYIGIERLTFPRADLIAAQQLTETVLDNSGATASFGSTMAALASGKRPLRRFAEIPRWTELASDQIGLDAELAMLNGVYNDMLSRWDIHDPADPRMDQPFQLARYNQLHAVVVAVTMKPLEQLFDLMQTLRTEVVGTRQSLALMAYSYRYGAFAPKISSVRPVWLVELAPDPLLTPDRGLRPPMEYFVPGRDTPGPTHTMNIVMGDGVNFSKNFDDSEFIVYSVGTDEQRNWATDVQNTMEVVFGADYLIWPPQISLVREELRRRGELN